MKGQLKIFMHLRKVSYMKEKVQNKHKKRIQGKLSLGNRRKHQKPYPSLLILKEIKKKIASLRREQDNMKKNREHKIATEYKKVITENLKIQLKF